MTKKRLLMVVILLVASIAGRLWSWQADEKSKGTVICPGVSSPANRSGDDVILYIPDVKDR